MCRVGLVYIYFPLTCRGETLGLCHSDTGRQSKMCGRASSSWLLKILRCVSVDGIHIQKPQSPYLSRSRAPAAGIPQPIFSIFLAQLLHTDPVFWDFFFFFFLTSVLPLLYEIFSFFVVFKTFSSNRSKERAF